MAHSYEFSPMAVLRLITWSLVREYFASRQLFLGLPCLQQDKPDYDALSETFQTLATKERTDVEEELQDIYDLSDEQGESLLRQEATFRGFDLNKTFTDLGGEYDVAMWSLLHQEQLFVEALRFRQADTLNRRYWRRRRGVPNLAPKTSTEAIERLSRDLSTYLVRQEGRGHYCHVDVLQRSSGYLFSAYPQDFGQTMLEYDESDNLVRRKYLPAKDLLFFYMPERNILEVFCHGTKGKVRDLQQLFALAILGTPLPPDAEAEHVYDLGLLKDEHFAFVIDLATGLDGIEVKSVVFRDRNDGRHATLQVDGPAGKGVLFAAEKYWATIPGTATDRYPLAQMDITRAKLQAVFRPVGKRRAKSRTFPVTPDGCLLDQEGVDGIIRRVLVASGLEQPAKVAALV